MSGNLEAVFSQVVIACSFAALAAIAMREATADRTLHLCARVLGLSAWTTLLALSYFTVREYEKLERVLIVRQSHKAGVGDDNGRERTIERIECPEGTIIEREHRSGWRVSFSNGSGLAASGALLQRTEPGAAIDAAGPHCECSIAGCPDCLLGVSGCCQGDCRSCPCESLQGALSGINF